ncbi:MAG TPA: NUDIX domain-containing protein [Rariglobus sp.]|jgi:8-oxo-dGTP diphosphatase|nr:NUDIX domain-containing protein [Rariglobus sp.]
MNYVAGFLFKNNDQLVALIEKKRPAWQAGRLNGIGGKIEAGESAPMAMRREFMEEAGVHIYEWRLFAVLNFSGGSVYFFMARGDFPLLSNTDEIVSWYPVETIAALPTIPNLRWLIPLAIDKDQVFVTAAERV